MPTTTEKTEKLIEIIAVCLKPLPYIIAVTLGITNKDEINKTTINVEIKDNSHITPELLKRYEEVKLMEEMKSFDLGQVLLGAMAGLVLGGIGMMFFIMMYNSMM